MRVTRLASGLAIACMLSACIASGAAGFGSPLSLAHGRPTPLHFGLYVTPDPDNNPIDPPERFTGYHVGLDFEIFPGEEDEEVPVMAVCSGKVTSSGFADGYGGLVMQECTLNGEPIQVWYGHLSIPGLIASGTDVNVGDVIGVLGAARTHDSGGNRKHLHLGMRKGSGGQPLGYVQTEAEIEDFIDPASVLPL